MDLRPSQWLIPDHGDALGIGSPNGKVGPLHSAVLHHMRAELFIDLVMRTFVEEVDIHLTEHWSETIRILLSPRFPKVAFHLQLIIERSLNAAQGGFKKTIGMHLLQGKAAILIADVNDHDLRGIGTKNARELAALKIANSKELKGIEVASFDQGIKIVVGERRGIHARSLAFTVTKSKTEKAGK